MQTYTFTFTLTQAHLAENIDGKRRKRRAKITMSFGLILFAVSRQGCRVCMCTRCSFYCRVPGSSSVGGHWSSGDRVKMCAVHA